LAERDVEVVLGGLVARLLVAVIGIERIAHIGPLRAAFLALHDAPIARGLGIVRRRDRRPGLQAVVLAGASAEELTQLGHAGLAALQAEAADLEMEAVASIDG